MRQRLDHVVDKTRQRHDWRRNEAEEYVRPLAAILCTGRGRRGSCVRIRRSLMAELGRTTSTPAARPVIRRHPWRGDYIGEMKI